jgi:hypothetical protein
VVLPSRCNHCVEEVKGHQGRSILHRPNWWAFEWEGSRPCEVGRGSEETQSTRCQPFAPASHLPGSVRVLDSRLAYRYLPHLRAQCRAAGLAVTAGTPEPRAPPLRRPRPGLSERRHSPSAFQEQAGCAAQLCPLGSPRPDHRWDNRVPNHSAHYHCESLHEVLRW